MNLKKNFQCDACDFICNSIRSLWRHKHQRSHGKTYECKECKESFKTIENLVKHTKEAHQNYKPFMCHICEQNFTKNYNLKKHLKKHKENNFNITDSNNNDVQSYHDQSTHECEPSFDIQSTSECKKQIREIGKCVSCKKTLKTKNFGYKWKYDKRQSFELDHSLCDLASKHWTLS